MNLVVGVTGASGAVYARRLLEVLREGHVAAHVVVSKIGRLVWREELGGKPEDLGFPVYSPGDLAAPFASGSSRFEGMIVAPCSAGCLGRIAAGTSPDLIARAADVTLKERRPLVLMLRESPYSLIQIRNMATVTQAGAVVLPASPSFYSKPQTMLELVDTVVARALDRVGVDNELRPRWSGALGDS